MLLLSFSLITVFFFFSNARTTVTQSPSAVSQDRALYRSPRTSTISQSFCSRQIWAQTNTHRYVVEPSLPVSNCTPSPLYWCSCRIFNYVRITFTVHTCNVIRVQLSSLRYQFNNIRVQFIVLLMSVLRRLHLYSKLELHHCPNFCTVSLVVKTGKICFILQPPKLRSLQGTSYVNSLAPCFISLKPATISCNVFSTVNRTAATALDSF